MQTITITISAQTLNTIAAALQEIPYKLAKPAIAEIEAEVNKYLSEQKKNVDGIPGTPSNAGSADA